MIVDMVSAFVLDSSLESARDLACGILYCT